MRRIFGSVFNRVTPDCTKRRKSTIPTSEPTARPTTPAPRKTTSFQAPPETPTSSSSNSSTESLAAKTNQKTGQRHRRRHRPLSLCSTCPKYDSNGKTFSDDLLDQKIQNDSLTNKQPIKHATHHPDVIIRRNNQIFSDKLNKAYVSSSSISIESSSCQNEFDRFGSSSSPSSKQSPMNIAASCNHCIGHLADQAKTSSSSQTSSSSPAVSPSSTSRSESRYDEEGRAASCLKRAKAILDKNSPREWTFDIFAFAEKAKKETFAMLAMFIFDELNLLDVFALDIQALYRFMVKLQSTYRSNPYHTFIHAADVLHTSFYLTTQARNMSRFTSDSNFTNQSKGLGPLDLLSLYLAALMHDAGHIGRTNKFLVEQGHDLAIRYNDRSVLENYHAAYSWEILMKDKYFFLKAMNETNFRNLRRTTIELILATDMACHREIIQDFEAKYLRRNRLPIVGKFKWNCLDDRIDLCRLIIKMADVATPCKPENLYLNWARRVQDEFYLQGDEEKKRGMSVSKNFDRYATDEISVQIGFMRGVTGLLLDVLTESYYAMDPVLIESDSPNIELRRRLKENCEKLESLELTTQKLPSCSGTQQKQ